MNAEEEWTARRSVVQPRHRNNPNTLTRWTRMLAAPSRDWSVFQQIFADHWEAFQHAHPRYQTPYYDGLVAQDAGVWQSGKDRAISNTAACTAARASTWWR